MIVGVVFISFLWVGVVVDGYNFVYVWNLYFFVSLLLMWGVGLFKKIRMLNWEILSFKFKICVSFWFVLVVWVSRFFFFDCVLY